jgi:Immunoglobulin I-set domain
VRTRKHISIRWLCKLCLLAQVCWKHWSWNTQISNCTCSQCVDGRFKNYMNFDFPEGTCCITWFKRKMFVCSPTPRVTWTKVGGPALDNGRVQMTSFGQELSFETVEFSDEGTYECSAVNSDAGQPRASHRVHLTVDCKSLTYYCQWFPAFKVFHCFDNIKPTYKCRRCILLLHVPFIISDFVRNISQAFPDKTQCIITCGLFSCPFAWQMPAGCCCDDHLWC